MPICIILDEPENPDNIGAAVRSMKNMGLKDLRLVLPPEDWRYEANKLAVGAADLLDKAKVFSTLEKAIEDRQLVIGTTRRHGGHRRAHIEFEKAMQGAKVRGMAGEKIAVVFGKESKGLSNDSLRLCDWYTTIPTSPAYPSMNLAQTVMIVCFSLFTGKIKVDGYEKWKPVNKKEFESVMKNLNEALECLEYNPSVATRIDHTFRDFVKRTSLLKTEAQMFLGLSKRIKDRAAPLYNDKPSNRPVRDKKKH